MTTLLASIHQPLESAPVPEALVSAVCPYLCALGTEAKIVAVHRFRLLKAGEPAARVVLVELALPGLAPAALGSTATLLEKFLRQLGKDANSSAGFALHVFDDEARDG